MGLDRLGPHRKSQPTDEDIGDSTLGVEFESIDILRDILQELVTINNYFALMNNNDNPPTREINDTD